ncbi:MAG: hypothetical protein JO197_04400 [Acidobacteria bacterium]|nr:hypothetical protein [Acidobacteriota bacterium]MBV9478544.1 hypothetical protein [Acidobacteriota bacterium]
MLAETAAEFGIVIDGPGQMIDFGYLPSDEVQRFGQKIREQQYSIDPRDFLRWRERGVQCNVGALVSELAGKDDTPGND